MTDVGGCWGTFTSFASTSTVAKPWRQHKPGDAPLLALAACR
jgi:hypothetical protein